jgi:hypothetical protein
VNPYHETLGIVEIIVKLFISFLLKFIQGEPPAENWLSLSRSGTSSLTGRFFINPISFSFG